MNTFNDEILDLLTQRALDELSREDQARLAELLTKAGLSDSDDMALAAAAAMNAFAAADDESCPQPVPDALGRKLRSDADRFFAGEAPSSVVTEIDSARSRRIAGASDTLAASTWSGRLGWAVAALLVVTVIVQQLYVVSDTTPALVSEGLDPAAARAALIAEDETSVAEWSQSDIPAYNRVSGDVVWNDARQEGYLRLSGMPANDPSISQYQLWIVDPGRGANPVDGGVFDVPRGTGEIIIPIRAKLDVSDPQAFAITREQPGGVVVSDGPLLIVAAT